MTVPTHNLYDFVHQVTKNKYLLLYFYPWGYKDLSNIYFYQPDQDSLDSPNGIPIEHRYPLGDIDASNSFKMVKLFQPIILCHDQEPLHFDLYKNGGEYVNQQSAVINKHFDGAMPPEAFDSNLRLALPGSLQKTWILLHSELNSPELKKYESTGSFQGAFWWSHAVIARDWYRFAEFDQRLKPTEPQTLFLSYCRDTSGNRSYRRDFLDLTQQYNIQEHCQFQSFDGKSVDSNASAIYNVEDFNHTAISVVLETVFDQRIHLTEKILRAIACGHPFMLAAGPGSLKFLRSYGFHTFHGYIDESYDDINDPVDRLAAIVKEMKRIADLPQLQKNQLIDVLRGIAAHNKQRFFSREFYQQIIDQLGRNVETAFEIHGNQLNLDLWWQRRRWTKQNVGTKPTSSANPETTKLLIQLYRQFRLNKTLGSNNNAGPTVV